MDFFSICGIIALPEKILGRMLKMVFKNYYKILDLETSHVSIEEIKIAYRQAAKKYHPDLNVGDNLAEEKIKDINEAYRTLSVPASKRKYDRIWNARFNKGQKAFSGKGEKGKMLEMFIGNIEKQEKASHNIKHNITKKGENIETEINISIEEAYYGMEKKLSFRTYEGKNKNIEIKIPQGIQNGEKIRLIGQGKPGENGGKNGDLVIKINIEDTKKFKLKANDLYTDLYLTPWEAVLGVKANVNSIDYDQETKIYIPRRNSKWRKNQNPRKRLQKCPRRKRRLNCRNQNSSTKKINRPRKKNIWKTKRNINFWAKKRANFINLHKFNIDKKAIFRYN